MFKEKYPATWSFHHSTCRSGLNMLQLQHADSNPGTFKEYLSSPVIDLPVPKIPEADFKDLIYNRYSCRKFKNEALQLQDIANTLFAGYGARDLVMMGNSEFRERSIPSGGGLYSLELYLLVTNVAGLQPGIYHYGIAPAILELVKAIELPKSFLDNLFLHQPYVAEAPVIIIATSVIERTMKKYFDRGYRYILLEAGHCFQNINLMAAACKLGSLNIGGFFDMDLCNVLGIDIEEEIPLYAMALGLPAAAGMQGRMGGV